MSDVGDEDDRTPWKRPPSGRPRKVVITEPVPPVVKAVQAQRLFIEKTGLPSALLDQLMRLAAFQNPEIYKKQSMRLSTALTPRVIACAEDLREHIALPRDCLPEAEAMLKKYGVTIEVTDEREAGTPVDFVFQGTLTPLQEQAVMALLAHDTGVFVAQPGIGKTVVGTYLVAARKTSTCVFQYTGRLHRLHPGKTDVRIYDYVDHAVPMLMKMFEKRLRGYRAIGYARDEAPLGLREVEDEAVVEYDEDVLRDLEEQEP